MGEPGRSPEAGNHFLRQLTQTPVCSSLSPPQCPVGPAQRAYRDRERERQWTGEVGRQGGGDVMLTSKCPSLSLATLWRWRYAVLHSPSRLLVRQTEREREERGIERVGGEGGERKRNYK